MNLLLFFTNNMSIISLIIHLFNMFIWFIYQIGTILFFYLESAFLLLSFDIIVDILSGND